MITITITVLILAIVISVFGFLYGIFLYNHPENNHPEDDHNGVLMIILSIAIFGTLVSTNIIVNDKWQKEAIEKGHAEWAINHITGKRSFEWETICRERTLCLLCENKLEGE